MNKACKKIAIVAVLLLAIGLVIAVVGFVLGGTNAIIKDNNGFRVIKSSDTTEIDIVDETFSDVKNISINIDNMDNVVLKKGDSFSVKGRNPKINGGLNATTKNGTLNVSTNKTSGWFIFNFGFLNFWENNEIGNLEITYPENAFLENVDIDIDLGDLQISDLRTDRLSAILDMGSLTLEKSEPKKLILDLDLGACNIDEVSFDNAEIECDKGDVSLFGIDSKGLKLECNMGSVNFEGTLLGKSDLQLDLGSAELTLNQSRTDTSLNISVDLGDVTIDGADKGSIEENPSGSNNNIEIDAEMGSVDIDFMK